MRVIARLTDENNLPRRPNGSFVVPPGQIFLTVGKEYDVHSMGVFKGKLNFHVLDDSSWPSWYPALLFDVTDTTMPPDWICNTFRDASVLVLGPEFVVKDIPSFDAMAENDIDARRLFLERIDRLLGHKVATFYNRVRDNLSPKVREEIQELLELDEKEYALELTCQELMDSGLLDLEGWRTCIELAKSLKLDEAETIRWDFWKRLVRYEKKVNDGSD